MSARKPLAGGCTGSIFCPVAEHVRRIGNRISHIPLTRGQYRTLFERRRSVRAEGTES